MRLGRMTALSNDDGGVRGIATGDVIRQLTARTIQPAPVLASTPQN